MRLGYRPHIHPRVHQLDLFVALEQLLLDSSEVRCRCCNVLQWICACRVFYGEEIVATNHSR